MGGIARWLGMDTGWAWRWPGQRTLDRAGALAAVAVLSLSHVQLWLWPMAAPVEERAAAGVEAAPSPRPTDSLGRRERLIAGYIGAPYYYRSDLRMTRPDGTDATFKDMGWDGDPYYPPIDGGVRAVEWSRTAPRMGFMVDFLHNKAIARLGRGAHGRKLKDPVIETVDVAGRIAGQPAPARITLTDVFERLEFTHGHNMLFFTPMARLGELRPGLRPYVGAGAGFSLPHVEVWFPGGIKDDRTNEYQYSGPALQLVAGLEWRVGRFSYFVEYKFSYSWIRAALTGDESWKNFNMPGDLLRQVTRWWSGEAPRFGTISTTLAAHNLSFGAGFWWPFGPTPQPAP